MREKSYRIGEAADMLHLKSYVLRFWETEFPQLAPLRTDKGQRLYTDHHIALLHRIKQLLHEQGMTIEGARRVLVAADRQGAQQPSSPAELQAVSSVAAPLPSPPHAVVAGASPATAVENGKNPAIDRALVREMREELLALRHMLTADE